MSIGPTSAAAGLAGGVAAGTVSQGKGNEAARGAQEVRDQQRRVEGEKKAADAAGIGATDGQEHEAAERDADGRRLLEAQDHPKGNGAAIPESQAVPTQSRDASGQSGTQLDLTG